MQISSSISTTHQLAGTREGYNYRQATDQSWSDQSVSGLSDFGSTRKQAWDQLEKAMIFFPHESTSNMKCADQQQSSSDYRKSSLLQAKDMVNLHNYEDLAAGTRACHPALNLSQTGGYNWVNTEGDTFKNVGLLQEGMSHTALINYQLQEGNYSPPALNKYQAYSPTNYNHKGAGGSSANSAVFTAGNAALATVHGTDRIRTLHESEKGQLMQMSGRARIGLNLGGRTYFAADDYAERLGVVGDDFGFGKGGPSKPSLRPGPLCRVDACQTDLSTAKRYHRRHKVCDSHSKAATVLISKQAQRFCQQCSRFHTLSEFDDGKRSCRKRLANHNKRRRKPPPISTLSKSIPTTLIDHKNSNELCKEMKVAS